MLNTKDIGILREMFRDHEIRFDQKLDDLKVNLRDEMYSLVKASEAGLIREMHNMKTEILDEIVDVLHRQILPQIDDHEQRIGVLEFSPSRR